MSGVLLLSTGLALIAQGSGARVMRSDDISPFASKETTVNGCDCTNQCGTSSGNYWKCDWCNVPSSCSGKRWTILRGNYDFCAYEKVNTYEAQSYSKKMSTLWNSVMATKGKSREIPSAFDSLTGLLSTSMRTPFDNKRDVMPEGRSKVIHVQGAVCQFALDVSSSSPYSGLLSPGTSHGLVRMGSATPAWKGMFPGMAIKFVRSGVNSANFVALRAEGASGSGNFFEKEMSNHVSPSETLQALQKFQQASDCVSMVGLSDVCRYDQNGKHTRTPKFPFELLFHGHSDTNPYNTAGPDPLSTLTKIPAGTTLFKVYAKASPKSSKVFLGNMRTETGCHSTLFGDEKLFFEHQRMEEDFKLRPDWIPDSQVDGCKANDRDVSEWQCLYNQ